MIFNDFPIFLLSFVSDIFIDFSKSLVAKLNQNLIQFRGFSGRLCGFYRGFCGIFVGFLVSSSMRISRFQIFPVETLKTAPT